MLGQLTGTVAFVGANFFILTVSGVGYKVFATIDTLRALGKTKDDGAKVWTHLAVRENALDLYGFIERSELEFFEMLITISGIGPKSALGILSVAPVDTLRRAISSGDTSYLTKVSGIGRKNAEKIVVELRDKLGAIDANAGGTLREEVDALSALEALGYSAREAREALKAVGNNAISTQEKLKAALKSLGSGNN
ncbi:MAG: Holliday junction branch migration protein RuvA [Patescibacteria group bacterium]